MTTLSTKKTPFHGLRRGWIGCAAVLGVVGLVAEVEADQAPASAPTPASTPAAAPASAALPTAPDALKRMDAQLNSFTDGTWESKLFVFQPDGKAREYSFTTFQRVPEKRLVRFTAPGDIKGMGFLIESAETMYAYLPGFQKVRRMGTHVKNQTFMGSDFGFDDASQTAFGTLYDAKTVTKDGDQLVLLLEQKKGRDLEYPQMRMWIDTTIWAPTKIEHCDAQGKKLKTQLRLDYKKDSARHFNPGKIVMTDHRRNDHRSEIHFLSSKIDTNLSEDLFTLRSLQRGN